MIPRHVYYIHVCMKIRGAIIARYISARTVLRWLSLFQQEKSSRWENISSGTSCIFVTLNIMGDMRNADHSLSPTSNIQHTAMPRDSAMSERVGSSAVWKFQDFVVGPYFITSNVRRFSRLITPFRNLIYVVKGHCEHDLSFRTLCTTTLKAIPSKVAVPTTFIALICAFLVNLRTRPPHSVRVHGSSKRLSTSSA